MSSNTSATGGYLQPTDNVIDDQALDRLFQQAFVAITGFDNSLVRPRWQEFSAIVPDSQTNWLAFGVTSRTIDDNPYLYYSPMQTQLQRTENFNILCSFYGTNCQSNAGILRESFYITQNNDYLNQQGISFVKCSDLTYTPELYNERWFKRADITLTFTRLISRTYAILPLIESKGNIQTNNGLNNNFDTNNN